MSSNDNITQNSSATNVGAGEQILTPAQAEKAAKKDAKKEAKLAKFEAKKSKIEQNQQQQKPKAETDQVLF